jgi:hypothetical protein
MNTLCDAVESDFPISSFNVRESVHSALGQLIKQRKVYYTGKGYFLVTPSTSATADGSIITSPLIKGLGNRINRLRHSLRDRTTPNVFNSSKLVDRECQTAVAGSAAATNGAGDVTYAVVHKDYNGGGGTSPDSSALKHASPQISPVNESNPVENGSGRNFALERSQSLRVSKKSLRNMSKGGSLRYSMNMQIIQKLANCAQEPNLLDKFR